MEDMEETKHFFEMQVLFLLVKPFSYVELVIFKIFIERMKIPELYF